MSIKNDKLYKLYLEYLNTKRISKGAYELYKISSVDFNLFKERYENDPFFNEEQNKILKGILRDEKITDIVYDQTERNFEHTGETKPYT